MMQIIHITLIFMCKYRVAGALRKAELRKQRSLVAEVWWSNQSR